MSKTARLPLTSLWAMRISSIRSTVFSAGAFTVLMLLTVPLVRLFTRDEELMRIAVPALRTVALAYPVIGLQMMGAAMFQAFGKGAHALFLTLSRQIVFLIPLVLVLPRVFGLKGIFWSFPAADVLATVVTVAMLTREFRRLDDAETANGVLPRAANSGGTSTG